MLKSTFEPLSFSNKKKIKKISTKIVLLKTEFLKRTVSRFFFDNRKMIFFVEKYG